MGIFVLGAISAVQGIKCYKGVTTDGISSMPSQKTEKNCTEGVTQCWKKSEYYLPSGYISPQVNRSEYRCSGKIEKEDGCIMGNGTNYYQKTETCVCTGNLCNSAFTRN